MTETVYCGLGLTCDWGGRDYVCCVSCPRFKECKESCRKAEEWVIKGVACEHAKKEAPPANQEVVTGAC